MHYCPTCKATNSEPCFRRRKLLIILVVGAALIAETMPIEALIICIIGATAFFTSPKGSHAKREARLEAMRRHPSYPRRTI